VPNFEVFLVLRFVAGLGLGGVWGAVSTYVVETWPVVQRGRAAAFVLSSFPAGGVVAALLAAALLPNWRLLFFLAGVGVVVPMLIVGLFFSESVEWAEQKSTPVAPSRHNSAHACVSVRSDRDSSTFHGRNNGCDVSRTHSRTAGGKAVRTLGIACISSSMGSYDVNPTRRSAHKPGQADLLHAVASPPNNPVIADRVGHSCSVLG
jgi:MFS family permease